jgi:hypothetical protein
LTSFFSNAHPIKLSTFNQAEPVPKWPDKVKKLARDLKRVMD